MRRFDSEQRIESYPVISNLTASEVLIGMDDKTRLRILTDAHINVPARATSFNETQDPFGLLEHRDTYEVFAEQIFSECEGVYRTIAKENPKVLKTVYKAKNGDSTIELPTVSLGSLFNFHMVRSIEGRSTQFSFTRTDEGYESSGFLVMQNDSGHFVLKNIAQGETDIKNDVNYFHLLH